jgi:hypothetical protein
MTYEEIKESLTAAQETMNYGEQFAKRGIEMARGKLRHIGLSSYVLADLKRELNRFDINKMRWKR